MRIRKATLADAAELARLRRGTIRSVNSAHYSAKQIEVWSKRTDTKQFRESESLATRYVAEEKGEIVGFADFKKKDPKMFWRLYVHHKHLGRGIGKALLAKMEQVARKMGAKKFRLESTITAKSFYESQGFKVLRKGKHPVKDQFLTVYVMEKRL